MSVAGARVVVTLIFAIVTSTLADPEKPAEEEQPLVHLPSLGTILGTTNQTAWNNHTVYQFQGIPYALPPSGHRRFKPPEPTRPWPDVLNATKFGKKCPQANTEKELQELKSRIEEGEDVEDCLTLNVYTPIDPNKCEEHSLPVMFYVHGGSFRVGSAQDFLPNYLLDEKSVILVVPQYRLGPLGFLSLQTDDIPGNMGFMDMLLALKWTQQYIKYFCGDAMQITLFGQSAGAAAVTLMLASPLVKPNMFQRVIVQSGSSLCDWALDREPKEHAVRIAELANCTDNNLEELTLCLHHTNAWELLVAHSDFLTEVLMTEGQAVKGNNGGNHAVIQESGSYRFLVEDPHILFKEGRYRHVPMMAGVTKHEGSFFLGNIYDFILARNNVTNNTDYLREEFIKDTLQFSGIVDTTGAITDIFQDKYFKENEVGNFTAMIPGLIDICGVTLLKACLLQQIRHNRFMQPSYLYSFNYKGHLTKFGYGEEVNYPFKGGVAHSDDLIYLFPFYKGQLYDQEAEIARVVVKLWTSFAINGKPSLSDGSNIDWLPMNSPNGPYLRIDRPFSMHENFIVEYNVTMTEGFNGEIANTLSTNGQNNQISILDIAIIVFITSLQLL